MIKTKKELEEEIKKLKKENQILLRIASSISSYPSDCDLRVIVNDYEIMYGMYGGFSVLEPGKNAFEDWERFSDFNDVLKFISKE